MSTITEPHPVPSVHTPLPLRSCTDAVVGATACQLCGHVGAEPLLDMGRAPLVTHPGDVEEEGHTPLRPLRVVRCTGCGALQLDDALDPDDRHRIATAIGDRSFAGRPDVARRFCEDAIDRWALRGEGHVVEIGSGTGSLLRFFRAWQLPVLGVEPDQRLTRYARLRRVPTWRARFDAAIAGRIARAGMHADLLILSMPTGAFGDVRELLASAATIVRPGGAMTMEVPDALRIVGRTRLDEVSHAHRIIPTVGQLQRAAASFGCELIDVERATPSERRLRVWIQRPPARGTVTVRPRLRTRLRAEAATAIDAPTTTTGFARRAQLVRDQVVGLLDDARAQHCTVAASGAGPTSVALANLAGLTRPDVAYVVDADPVRCGTTLPGTDIPVVSPDQTGGWRPDLVLGLDDMPASPDAWEGAPVYAVSDLIDVVHRLTGAVMPHLVTGGAPSCDDAPAVDRQLPPGVAR